MLIITSTSVTSTAGRFSAVTGPQLKALRKRLGLSLAPTAQQLGVSARSICRWESERRATPAGAQKLFQLLNKVK